MSEMLVLYSKETPVSCPPPICQMSLLTVDGAANATWNAQLSFAVANSPNVVLRSNCSV